MRRPDGIESEQWGFEDPRAVWVAELERWLITCTAYGPSGPAVYLASTTDFRTVERIGIICQPEDKNAALLPERVDGEWILFHRPMTSYGGSRGEIVLSRSDDLTSWGAPEQVLQPRHGAWWDSLRIGIGPPPLRTDARLAGDLPRCQGDRCRHHLPRRSRVDSTGRPGTRPAPRPELGARALRPVRTRGRHTRTPCSRAGSYTTRSRGRSGSTTEQPTRRSVSRPHELDALLDAVRSD